MSKGRTTLIRCGAVALASVATLAGVSAAAGAATSVGSPGPSSGGSTTTSTLPPTLAGIKSLAHTEITHRVETLNAAVTRVKAAKGLGSGQGSLETYLGQDVGPLQQLDNKIQGDSSVQEATADYGTIFSNFRVYRLVLPAAHVAVGASRITNTAVPSLQADAIKAQQHSSAAVQASLSALVANLNSQISTASKDTSGLAATVLAYTPAEWNSDNSLLSGPQASIGQAVAAVKQGRTDVQRLRQLLAPGVLPQARSGHGSKKSTGRSTSSTTS